MGRLFVLAFPRVRQEHPKREDPTGKLAKSRSGAIGGLRRRMSAAGVLDMYPPRLQFHCEIRKNLLFSIR